MKYPPEPSGNVQDVHCIQISDPSAFATDISWELRTVQCWLHSFVGLRWLLCPARSHSADRPLQKVGLRSEVRLRYGDCTTLACEASSWASRFSGFSPIPRT
eukprot:3826025-Amphidinium_carterae.1